MMRPKIDIITMGCSKNLVDSERLIADLQAAGYDVRHNPAHVRADIAVVNTCGFIADAKQESIEMILSLSQQKESGRLQQLYVMGCLSERYRQELAAEIPQVDRFFGKFDWMGLLKQLGSALPKTAPLRAVTTPKHYAYVKISEGCNRHCAYCAIPLMTGAHRSRTKEDILNEVCQLVARGVKEFQIIAQELTDYGTDLYHRPAIAELIDEMARIKGVEWIRLHYAYPQNFPFDLLDVMRRHSNVCKYLDIAFQHISTSVLQRMQRHIDKEQTLELIAQLRSRVPNICLRTTLMVGFPGETEEEFAELEDFVRSIRFDRMGAFAYSEEDGTYAARNYADDVPQAVKQSRLDRLMHIQEQISAELGQKKVGQTLRTIIDRAEGEYYIGRTEFDSPDVDSEVLIRRDEGTLHVGEFYPVEIKAADEFDLYGSVHLQSPQS